MFVFPFKVFKSRDDILLIVATRIYGTKKAEINIYGMDACIYGWINNGWMGGWMDGMKEERMEGTEGRRGRVGQIISS